MKYRKKLNIFFIIISVLTLTTMGIVVNATNLNNKNEPYEQLLFDAEITFYILTGEGCGCTPIEGATVSAYGGFGNDSAATDQDGKCVLTLVINGEYEIFIEGEGFREVNFELNIIDDQTFTFHLFEKKVSSVSANLHSFQLIAFLLDKLQNL